MLPRNYRLNSKQFNRIYKEGKKYRSEYGMLIAKKDIDTKFGFVINKKVGNAVLRHKILRQLHSITMDLIKKELFKDRNINFQYVVFGKTDSYSTLDEQYTRLIKKVLEDEAFRDTSN